MKDIHLTADAFTVENDMLTPTLKQKRPQIYAAYAKQLKAIYDKLD